MFVGEELEYWSLPRSEKSFSSLAGCYALLASLAAILLIYARFALQSPPPDSANLVGEFTRGSISLHAASGAGILAGTRAALSALRDRMHTTWLFLGVFAAVWLACLLWMQIERHRRGLSFSRKQAYWIAAATISVFAVAVLYGLGTNGILARRLPAIVPVSDVLALGFLLALPLVAWSRLDRLQEEQEDSAVEEEEGASGGRLQSILGLSEDESGARMVESLSRLEVKPVELLPAVQIFHPESPTEEAKAAVNQLIQTAEAPAALQSAAPKISDPIDSAPPVQVFHPESPTEEAKASVNQLIQTAEVSAALQSAAPQMSDPIEMLPAAQIFHPESPTEEARASVNQLIQTAEAPAAPQISDPTPVSAPTATPSPVPPVASAADTPAGTGNTEFRDHLAAMNQSWQRIELIRGEIDEWFEQQRRQAIARLDKPPAMRSSAREGDLFRNFPNEKLASVDAEWAEIRRAALEINRWFGETPAADERE